MSARVDGAWAEGFVIRRGDGLFYSRFGEASWEGKNGSVQSAEVGEWGEEAIAVVWRDKAAAQEVIDKLTEGDYEVLPAKLANGRTVLT